MDLLPLDEARRRLRVVGQSYLGVREIPVDRIIGSLDRTADFDRSFRPRRGALPEMYSYKTDTDVFLWIYQRRRALRVTDSATDFGDAARTARDQRVSRAFRRAFLREKGGPLRRRR